MDVKRKIPEWQQAIIDKCYHPTGVWEEFPESEYETSIPACFEKIVARYPDRLAVVDDQRSLTYAELNRAANRLAHGLLDKLGPGPEPIGHLFSHGVEAIVALLGVLKAGKFYAPLDTRSPADYLRRIQEWLECRLTLTDDKNYNLAQTVADGRVEFWTPAQITSSADHNPGIPIRADDYLYVVFTSGSTGAPKGVIENQRNALRYAALYINKHHICPDDCAFHSQNLSFSGSKQHLFGTLLSGSRLALYDGSSQAMADLPAWIHNQQVTSLTLAPGIFRALVALNPNPLYFHSVRLLRMIGDRVLPKDLVAFCRLMPDTTIFRVAWGASEAKIASEIFYDKIWAARTEEVSLGWPLADGEMLVVDETGRPVVQGETGEIVIHSRFISPGYWKEPTLTAQKFRPDPQAKGIFYYHSGDLGRTGTDGRVYFMGRADSQVKIRGQRVELDEIERMLWAAEGVRSAIAEVRGDTPESGQLIAWIECQSDHPAPTVSQLHRWLIERLPPQMIPHRFVFLERFPLNRNGKVDRSALPLPHRQRPRLETTFHPPRTPLEVEVALVWSEVLGMDEIGIHDLFVELGGNSLQAMRIAARLQDEFGVEIPLTELFTAGTVAEMALMVTVHLAASVAIGEQILLDNKTSAQSPYSHPNQQ